MTLNPGTRVRIDAVKHIHSGGMGTVIRMGTWNDSPANPTPGYVYVALDTDRAQYPTGGRTVKAENIAFICTCDPDARMCDNCAEWLLSTMSAADIARANGDMIPDESPREFGRTTVTFVVQFATDGRENWTEEEEFPTEDEAHNCLRYWLANEDSGRRLKWRIVTRTETVVHTVNP